MKKIVNKEETNKEKELVSSESCENKKGSNNKLWFINWSVFLVIGVFLFLLVQRILMPRWNWPQNKENLTWSMEEFRNLEKNSVDVVFLGVSHMQYAISPMEIYKEYGIVSYNLSTSSQPLDMSYYLLEEAFKRQSPSYVVLDTSSLFFSDNRYGDSAMRRALDPYPLSKEKIDAAKEYSVLTSDTSTKNKMERFNSIIFPIIYYHSNWKTLTKDNFVLGPNADYCTAGYVISPIKGEAVTDKAGVDAMTDEMLKDDHRRFVTKISSGEVKTWEKEEDLYSPEIYENQREWLKKISQLCKDNNAKLIMIKLPVLAYNYDYLSSWTEVKYNITKEFAEELGVDYYDFLYESDIDLDLKNDFLDSGWHLNYSGAVKASHYMGEYLVSNYHLAKKSSAYMDGHMENYDKLARVANIQLEGDFQKYTQLLQENSEDYIICIASRECWKDNLLENDEKALNNLGLYKELKEYSDTGNAYAVLIDAGHIEYEQISNRRINYQYKFGGKVVDIISDGVLSGNTAEIYIYDDGGSKGSSITINKTGLNIVVIDKATKKVVDSCYIDTNSEDEEEHSLIHSDNSNSYLYDIVYGDN